MTGPNFRFYDLEGRTILLTGVTRGIGKAIAPGLAAQGLRLVLLGKEEPELEQVVASLHAEGVWAAGVLCDLASPAERAVAIRQIDALAPTLDGIIHNAAIDPRRAFHALDLEFLREMFAVNVEPAVEITRDLLPNLRRSAAGRILLMGSVTFDLGAAYLSAYVASKGAIVGLTHSLAHELGSEGITVNCIAPGAVVVEKEAQRNTQETEALLIAWQSVKRRVVPADLLGTICLLLSDAGSAITGQVITIDGGLTHPIGAPATQEKQM